MLERATLRILVGLAFIAFSAAHAFAGDEYYRLQSQWRPHRYVHIEYGALEVAPVEPGWESAQWVLDPVEGTSYFRLKNRWKPELFINIEDGALRCSEIENGWHSAQWLKEPVAGSSAIRFQNVWKTEQYLHMQTGLSAVQLQSGPIEREWPSAQWKLKRVVPSAESSTPEPGANLHQLYKGGHDQDHFYTANAGVAQYAINHSGYVHQGIVGRCYSEEEPGTVPLYQLYNGKMHNHFYTKNEEHRDSAIADDDYRAEGITCWVRAKSKPGWIPLYRLYKHPTDHFYTTSASEWTEQTKRYGRRDEGVAAYVYKPPPCPKECQAGQTEDTVIEGALASRTCEEDELLCTRWKYGDITPSVTLEGTVEVGGTHYVTDQKFWDNARGSRQAKVTIKYQPFAVLRLRSFGLSDEGSTVENRGYLDSNRNAKRRIWKSPLYESATQDTPLTQMEIIALTKSTTAEFAYVSREIGGSEVSSEKIKLAWPAAPVAHITASPSKVCAGDRVDLNWRVDGVVTKVDVHRATVSRAAVSPSGSVSAGPIDRGREFSIVAIGPGGEDSKSVGVVLLKCAKRTSLKFTWNGLTIGQEHTVKLDGKRLSDEQTYGGLTSFSRKYVTHGLNAEFMVDDLAPGRWDLTATILVHNWNGVPWDSCVRDVSLGKTAQIYCSVGKDPRSVSCCPWG